MSTGSFLLGEFTKNPADWLSFLTTMILGAATVYFAARTRALERQQVRQINREFDREIVEAELELNAGATLHSYWEEWGGLRDLDSTIALFARSRSGIIAPDLTKVTRILAFHLPDQEDRARHAIIRLSAAIAALDFAIRKSEGHVTSEVARVATSVDKAIGETSAELTSVLTAIRRRRQELRA